MIKRVLIGISLAIAMIVTLLPVHSVSAVTPVTQVAVCDPGNAWGNFFGFQPWYACLEKDGKGKPMIKSINDLWKIAFPVVESIIKLAMYVAIGMIFFMLFKMVTANGNSSTYAQALGGMRDAVIGLIIAMISVAIVGFIANAFVVVTP
ncbi:MAG: hypothetical protein WAU02_00815 [Candidatus Saccharimonadales bacterium]